jgi:hypothetical protein
MAQGFALLVACARLAFLFHPRLSEQEEYHFRLTP